MSVFSFGEGNSFIKSNQYSIKTKPSTDYTFVDYTISEGQTTLVLWFNKRVTSTKEAWNLAKIYKIFLTNKKLVAETIKEAADNDPSWWGRLGGGPNFKIDANVFISDSANHLLLELEVSLSASNILSEIRGSEYYDRLLHLTLSHFEPTFMETDPILTMTLIANQIWDYEE